MNPANDNDELIEANVRAAKSIMDAPIKASELKELTDAIPHLTGPWGRVVTTKEDAC